MAAKFSAKSDLYQSFLLCVKFRVHRFYQSYDQFYQLLEDDLGWMRKVALERIREDIVHRRDDYLGRGWLLGNPQGEEVAVLEHESGAEVWILPVVTFVAGAIASGVIGNAAYDLIRQFYATVKKARDDDNEESTSDPYLRVEINIRTFDYETTDLAPLDRVRQREIIERAISTRIAELGIEGKTADRREQPGTVEELRKRIEQIEQQLGTIALKYVELTSEFQKERTEWRRRSAYLDEKLRKLQ